MVESLIIKQQNLTVPLLSSLTEPAFVIIMDTADLKDVASKPVLTGPTKSLLSKGEQLNLQPSADYPGAANQVLIL